MTAAQLTELLYERPFHPLRLHLANGDVREIHGQNLVLIARGSVAISSPRDEGSAAGARMQTYALAQVVRVEPIALVA